jgi:hypothetical protein
MSKEYKIGDNSVSVAVHIIPNEQRIINSFSSRGWRLYDVFSERTVRSYTERAVLIRVISDGIILEPVIDGDNT